MTRTLVLRLSAGAVFLVGGWIAYTQNPGQPPQLKVNQVKPDLYEIEGDGGNVAVYVTNEGLILVDDKFDRDHDAIVAQIKTFSNQPVKYILSTHYHEDHSGGNAKFLPTAEVISTANARANIVKHIQSNAGIFPTPARVVFTDETSVFLGGAEVRARYFGRGHTNGDAVVYFPASRTVSMGDMFSGTSPGVDYNGGGSLLELSKTLEKVLAEYDFDTVIPGHGPVTNRAALEAYLKNVQTVVTRAQAFIRQGKSQAELAKFMEVEFSWAPNSIQQVQNVPGMMTELK